MRKKSESLFEAAQWYLRRKEKATSHDEAIFSAWQSMSDQRSRDVEAIARVMKFVGIAASDPLLQDLANEAADRAASSRRLWKFGVLGGFAIAAPLAAFGLHRFITPKTSEPQSIVRVYRTSVGQERIIRVLGGRSLRLDSDSVAVLRYSTGISMIEVRGQAYLSGNKAQEPLMVKAGTTKVNAASADLNIRNINQRQEFIVLRNPASLGADSQNITLLPGQKVQSKAGYTTIRREKDVVAATGWRTGWLHFTDTPVSTAIFEMNRYRHHLIRVSPGVTNLHISGSFRTVESGTFPEMLETALPVRARTLADGSTVLDPK